MSKGRRKKIWRDRKEKRSRERYRAQRWREECLDGGRQDTRNAHLWYRKQKQQREINFKIKTKNKKQKTKNKREKEREQNKNRSWC
jgi:hypothetical protein